MKNHKNTIPNIWASLQNLIHFYRLLTAGLGVLSVFMFVLAMVCLFRDPIVVKEGVTKKEFYPSQRAAMNIEKSDIEAFTKDFLNALYVWPEFSDTALAKEVSPYVEDDLIKKIVEAQSLKYGKELKAKKISQSLTFIKVTVLEDRVAANFFRVLLIEGIPLVVPTELTLSVVKGDPTRLNPMGVYISGIIEHEGTR